MAPYTALLAGSDREVATTGFRFWKEDPLTCVAFFLNMAFVIVLIEAMISSSSCKVDNTDGSLLGITKFLGAIVVIAALGAASAAVLLSLVRNSIALLCAVVPSATLAGVCAVALAVFEPSSVLEHHNCSEKTSTNWVTGSVGVALSQACIVLTSAWRRHRLVTEKAHRRPIWVRHMQFSEDVDDDSARAIRADPKSELKKMLYCVLGLLAIFGIPAVFEAIIITAVL